MDHSMRTLQTQSIENLNATETMEQYFQGQDVPDGSNIYWKTNIFISIDNYSISRLEQEKYLLENRMRSEPHIISFIITHLQQNKNSISSYI